MWKWLGASVCLAVLAGLPAANAQSLGSGDYELCSVYRPDGSFAGYNSACLERQRAAIRRLNNTHSNRPHGGHYGHAPAPYATPSYAPSGGLCPSWANNGYGYSSTIRPGSSFNVQYGTFTSSYNGQPCTPNPMIFRRGIP